MRTIQFYQTTDKKSPVEEFLDSLNARVAQKVLWTFQVVKELENVPKQYLKKLDGTDNLWEIRVESSNTAIRFLGFWEEGNLILLTNGFIKKTQKTPRTEINLATERKAEYEQRNRNR